MMVMTGTAIGVLIASQSDVNLAGVGREQQQALYAAEYAVARAKGLVSYQTISMFNTTNGWTGLLTDPFPDIQAALCLRDPESQRTAAISDGLPPAVESVYWAPGMAKAYPMRQAILDSLRNAAARPMTPTYQNVSTVTAVRLSPPSAIDPPRTLRSLRGLIEDALQSKGVLP